MGWVQNFKTLLIIGSFAIHECTNEFLLILKQNFGQYQIENKLRKNWIPVIFKNQGENLTEILINFRKFTQIFEQNLKNYD